MAQVWTTKEAQNLKSGDIIANLNGTFALEVKEAYEQGGK